MRTFRRTRTSKMSTLFIALSVLVATLMVIAPPAAEASKNGLGTKDCGYGGWKNLENAKGASFQNELSCDLYAALGGVLKRKQTVAFTSSAPVPALVGAHYRPTAHATSGLPAAITLDPSSSGCTIASGLLTFTAPGTCVVDANQAGNDVYAPAPQVTQSITVTKAAQTITFGSAPPSPANVGATYRPIVSASSGLPVTLTADDSSTGCSVASGLVSFTGLGTCVLNADQPGNATYLPATRVTQTFSVTKKTQTISITSTPPSPGLAGSTYRPVAHATSFLPVTITLSSDSTGCTLASGLVTFTGVGTCIIDADQPGNDTYDSAPQVEQTIQVFKQAQSVKFTTTPPAPGLVGNTYRPFASSTSGLPAVISLAPTSTGCTLASGLVTFTDAGTCIIDADQPGSPAYDGAAQVEQTIQVVKKTQTLKFTTTAPTPGLIGNTYRPFATSSVGLQTVISLDPTSTGCTLNSGVVTFTADGTCIIEADQPGNATYDAAAQIEQTVNVTHKTQTVSFTTSPPSQVTIGGTYRPRANATSGLATVITLDAASTGCSLANAVVTFTGGGTCVLDANQPGNTTYAPALQVQQSIVVAGGTT